MANIHNHRHYCIYENCRWHKLRFPRKVFSLIILPQVTSLVYVDGSMSFVTPFLNVPLMSALCTLQICLLRKFTFRPLLLLLLLLLLLRPPPPSLLLLLLLLPPLLRRPPPSLLLLLLLLLHHMKCYVVLPQGSVLRPLLFNTVWCGLLFADYIIRTSACDSLLMRVCYCRRV